MKMTLDYWMDEGWYIGQLREYPSVLSQAKTLKELRENISDAYALVTRRHVQPWTLQTWVR